MIVVESGPDGEVLEFEEATRYSTDEHNNLELWAGADGDKLIQLFNARLWQTVGVA